MRYELDADGYFVCDLLEGQEAEFWTAIAMPQPIGVPRFVAGQWVDEAVPEPVAIPQVVTMRQARLALLGTGLLHQVDPAIDSLAEPEQTAARIEWEYSQVVCRDRPFVVGIGAALGLTDAQIDALFTAAAGIE